MIFKKKDYKWLEQFKPGIRFYLSYDNSRVKKVIDFPKYKDNYKAIIVKCEEFVNNEFYVGESIEFIYDNMFNGSNKFEKIQYSIKIL